MKDYSDGEPQRTYTTCGQPLSATNAASMNFPASASAGILRLNVQLLPLPLSIPFLRSPSISSGTCSQPRRCSQQALDGRIFLT